MQEAGWGIERVVVRRPEEFVKEENTGRKVVGLNRYSEEFPSVMQDFYIRRGGLNWVYVH